MCGRYSLSKDPRKDLEKWFPGIEFDPAYEFVPKEEIRPTNVCGVVTKMDGKWVWTGMRWGLIPLWSREEMPGTGQINARAETVADKPSFRAPFKRKRCVVPADAFYEWGIPPHEKRKRPHRLRNPKEEILLMAGLWDEWEGAKGCLRTFTIITTEANESVRVLHDRMPVIFNPEISGVWLQDGFEKGEFLKRAMPDSQPPLVLEPANLPSAKKRADDGEDLFSQKS